MPDSEPLVSCLRPDSVLCRHPEDVHHSDVLGGWHCDGCVEELDEHPYPWAYHPFRPVIVTPGGFLPYPAV